MTSFTKLQADTARRVIARLRHPLWDDLTPDELDAMHELRKAVLASINREALARDPA